MKEKNKRGREILFHTRQASRTEDTDNLHLVSISFQTSFGVAKITLEGTV